MSIYDLSVSLFKSAQSVEPTAITLGKFLQSRSHLDTITQLRAETNPDIRSTLKKTLPAVTISGTFTRRAAAAIENYNGLVCLDFDAKENPGISVIEMKTRLAEVSEIAYAARSVGGAGVFAIIPTNCTDPTQHPRMVEIIERLIQHIGLVADRACKDVSRLRFVSWDEYAYTNPEPTTFDARHWLQVAQRTYQRDLRKPRPIWITKPKPEGDTTRRKVEEYITAIESGCRDITDDYDNWLRLAFALANAFGIDGEDLFQRISQFNPKYDQADTSRKYKNALATGRSVRIGTFFKICNNQGIRL